MQQLNYLIQTLQKLSYLQLKKQFLILGPFNSFVLPSYVSCVKGQAKHLIEEPKWNNPAM